VAAVSVLGALAFTASPALAGKVHRYAGLFGGHVDKTTGGNLCTVASGDECVLGQEGSGEGQFKAPSGVAVEEVAPGKVGDVYVVDTGNNRVQWFNAEGKLEGQFNGTSAGHPLSSPQAIAIDNSTSPLDPSRGDVYVADGGHNVVDKFGPEGAFLGQITTGNERAPLSAPFGVSVDQEGTVWVYQESKEIDSYSNGEQNPFSASLRAEVFRHVTPAFAAATSEQLYAGSSSEEGAKFISKLNVRGERIVTVMATGFEERESGVAVEPPTSDVYIDTLSRETGGTWSVALFDNAPECTSSSFPCTPSLLASSLLERFGSGQITEGSGIAVNAASGSVYVADPGAQAVRVFLALPKPNVALRTVDAASESAALNGAVNPEGAAVKECFFEYGETTEYGKLAPCVEPDASEIGSSPREVAVHANVTGLTVRTAYHFRLVASNVNATAATADGRFFTTTAPVVEGGAVTNSGSVEANLAAHINPSGLPTTYRVQYGTGSVEESATPAIDIGASESPVAVSARLTTLNPGALYHFRFVASNRRGTTVGQESTFTTAGTPITGGESTCPNSTVGGFSPTLPDCRAYELVSNPIDETYVPNYDEETGGEHGTGEYIGTAGAFRADRNGEAVAYVGGESNTGTGGNGFTGDGDGNEYLATRGPTGWEASDIALPVNPLTGFSEYAAFSADLSTQVVAANYSQSEPISASPEPPADCLLNSNPETIYSRTASGLHALVTSDRPGSHYCGATPAGFSADDSHTLLESRGAFTAGAAEGAEESETNLYDSVKGSLHQVNILPGGEPEQQPHATFGMAFGNTSGTERYRANRVGAASSDGSRVFWTAVEGGFDQPHPKALYVRENDTQPQSPVLEGRCTVSADACTTQVDASQGGSGPGGGGYFWAASTNGSKVFFTDCSKLTSDSTASAEPECNPEGGEKPQFTGNDIYEYDLSKPAGKRLTDLTVDHNPSDALGADVQGVIGVSEDGSYAYFVAHGVLAGANAEGKAPQPGEPNLYFRHGGTTTFIATLASTDGALRAEETSSAPFYSDWDVSPGARIAEVTPSGSAIAFQSTLELTGYDNFEAHRQVHIPEAFVYEAASVRLSCASCDPTGAPPAVEPGSRPHGTVVAVSRNATFMSRWVVEREGTQVYFMTDQPLVPTDHNGLQDLYEWQSAGSGGCRQAGGCIKLISSADPLSRAYLIDASKDGRDVFFTTLSQLTPNAIGEKLKLYDARAGGGRAEPSLACTGTGCQGLPAPPPIFATPSSVTFSAIIGNFEPSPPRATPRPKPKPKPARCKRGFTRRHNRCVRSRARKAGKRAGSRHGGGAHHA
jgi:hypothetical protein